MILWRTVLASVSVAAWSIAPLFAVDSVTVVSRPAGGKAGQYVGNKEPLEPSPFLKLKIGSIQPTGWLHKQLELEAAGMGGQLEHISPSLKFENDGWVDPAGKNGWEEVPYWLRGYGDLGYVLNDPAIIAEAKKWIDGIISAQRPDGWFGPEALRTSLKGRPDMWPHMPILNAMQSYYEFSGDPRVLPFMTNYFKWQNTLPPGYFSKDWQDTRFGDNIESIYWLYNRTGDKWLLELPPKIHAHSAKWWKGVASWHNVNFAQGFREPAEYWMQTKDDSLLGGAERNYDTAMSLYGQFPGGGFAADENARKGYHDPRQGFETCGIVEFMRSFEMLSRISGDPTWLDRCEYIAFNDLPAALTADEKSLHYLTPANVVQLDDKNKSPGIENGGTMLSYSPSEPQYHCCQHNHVMGWPLYAEHLWMGTTDGGLAATLYSAGEVTAKVADGSTVKIAEATDYPFSDTIMFTISTEKASQFPLYFRVPAWCGSASMKVNGTEVNAQPKPLQYISIDRNWSNGDTITLRLPMKLGVRRWTQNGNSASVDYGPLSFSLLIGEKYVKYGGTDAWPEQCVYATTPWNYGLVLDDSNPAKSFEIVRKPGPVADQPFTIEDVPLQLKAKGKRIEEWTVDKNSLLRTLQQSPAKSDQPEEAITLIPMGAARLRISAFPVIGGGEDAHPWTGPKTAQGPAGTALATASHCFDGDTIGAINSGDEPKSSADEAISRMTFWNHRGTAEWLQYDFKSATDVSSVAVYWYDDTGHGGCRVPQSWRLLYREGMDWKPVPGVSDYGVAANTYNKVTFDKVNTAALRIELQLQPDMSAGVLQWQVNP